jgi:hypothetical protein
MVMTQPSRADDDAAKSVLATEAQCCHRVKLATTLPSHAGNDIAELVLTVAHQGATADH